jgi:Flp pilus assembly pilin Flp
MEEIARPVDAERMGSLRNEAGQTMPEYAVVLSLLTITAATLFLALSGGVANAMSTVTGVI